MSTKEEQAFDAIQEAVRAALVDIKADLERDHQNSDFIQFLKKKNAFRADALTLDWSDDKMVRLGSSGSYPYLSADKVKRNFAPLLSKHGLELELHFRELTKWDGPDDNKYHWTLILAATLYDVETGASMTSEAYGEGADSGESGIKKAQACALKQWLTDDYLIADGIDPDMVMTPSGTGFFKKTEEEQEEIISKVKAQGISPKEESKKEEPESKPEPKKVRKIKRETPKEEPKSEVKETPKKEEPEPEPEPVKEEPKAAPAENKPAEAPVPVENKPAEAPVPAVKAGVKLSKPHQNAIQHIVDVWTERAKAGEVGVEDYNKMSMDCASISSAPDAVAFVKKYRVG